MLKLQKVHSQHYKITGDIPLRNQIFKKMVWKHSQFVKNYIFAKAYREGRWNGRVYTFSPTSIRAGYLAETIEVLESSECEYETDIQDVENDFTYKEFHKFCCDLVEAVNPKFAKKHNIELEIRDYQIDAAWKFINQPHDVKTGIAHHATAAGKSLTIAFILGFLFYKKLISKAIILVPLQSLVTQFYENLLEFGFKDKSIGKLFAHSKQTNRAITISTNPSTKNIIGSSEEENFFDNIDLVICDEVHKASSKTVRESVERFHNAKYFFGCTGTLPEDEADKEVVHSLFGNVLDRRSWKELKEQYDAVSDVKVGVLNFSYGMKSLLSRHGKESHMDWQSEVEFLQNDFEFRNPYIIQTILNNFNRGENIIVLFKNIDYGLKMYHKISEDIERKYRKSIFWIDGSMPLKERDVIISKCRKSKAPYIINTNYQIFSTGLNIPNISTIFIIDAGESSIAVAQTLGRGVRKFTNKEEVLIIDCASDLKYGNRHKNKRKKIYATEGFTVLEKTIYKDSLKSMQENLNSQSK